jgi:hypothetical protein
MKTYQEYFEDCSDKLKEKLFSFFEDKGVSGEKEHYEWSRYFDWYIKHRQYEISQYVRVCIVPEIKKQRKENRKRKYICVVGLHGYSWFGHCCSLTSCANRVGQFSKIEDVLEDSFFEYVSLTQEDKETLTITAMTHTELKESGLFGEFNDNTVAMNVKSGFWKHWKVLD